MVWTVKTGSPLPFSFIAETLIERNPVGLGVTQNDA
jgi:hypothetical protein